MTNMIEDNMSLDIPCAEKVWRIKDEIRSDNFTNIYIADLAKQNAELVSLISKGFFLSLHGSPGSGKSTQIFWTIKELEKIGYHCFYIGLKGIDLSVSERQFWREIGEILKLTPEFKNSPIITNAGMFGSAFTRKQSSPPVIIFFDDFDLLQTANQNVRDSFLCSIRAIKHYVELGDSAIHSIVTVGTSKVISMDTCGTYTARFNCMTHFQHSDLDKNQVQALFEKFSSDRIVILEPDVIEDIYWQTNGHATLICICGLLIDTKLKTLVSNRTFSLADWKKFSVPWLSCQVIKHPLFKNTIKQLVNSDESTIKLLQSNYLGNPTHLRVSQSKIKKVNSLAEIGVLRYDPEKKEAKIYSPLLSSVITDFVLPQFFKNSIRKLPKRSRNIPNINFFQILKQAVVRFNIFENQTNQTDNSDKPLNAVYQIRLAIILNNWLREWKCDIMSQYYFIDTIEDFLGYALVITTPDGQTTVITANPIFSESRYFENALANAKKFTDNDNIWIVQFTTEKNLLRNPLWPSDQQMIEGLKVIIFWHDDKFKKVLVSTYWIDEKGKKQKIIGKEVKMSNDILS